MDKVTKARDRRGLTISDLAREANVNWQVLRNLEGGPGATRDSNPAGVSLSTAMRLIERLWPDLQLADFDQYTLLAATPKDSTAVRQLSVYTQE